MFLFYRSRTILVPFRFNFKKTQTERAAPYCNKFKFLSLTPVKNQNKIQQFLNFILFYLNKS